MAASLRAMNRLAVIKHVHRPKLLSWHRPSTALAAAGPQPQPFDDPVEAMLWAASQQSDIQVQWADPDEDQEELAEMLEDLEDVWMRSPAGLAGSGDPSGVSPGRRPGHPGQNQYSSASASGIKLHGYQKNLYTSFSVRSTAPNVSKRIRSRKHRLQVQADLGGIMDNFVTYGALSASVCAAAYAIYYKWPRNSGPAKLVEPVQSPDNFAWALMGAVSCLPLFNSTAWILGALQSDNPRPFYWAAALYALPLLRNGLDQDWFSLTLLLTGIAHMQALRVGATEPEFQAVLQQQLKPLSLDVLHQQGDLAHREGELRRLELEDFDRRLNLKATASTEAASTVDGNPQRRIHRKSFGDQ
eukprot:gene9360-9523_t